MRKQGDEVEKQRPDSRTERLGKERGYRKKLSKLGWRVEES